jgi:cytoskeletal protein RodZ
MDDIERLKQRWIEASRRRHAPSSAAVGRMRAGLRARIEAGEPAPSLHVEPESPAPAADVRPWLWGAGVLLAAAAVLLWDVRSARPQVARAPEPSAAGFDASDQSAAQAVRTAPERAVAESVEATPETPAPVAVEPPAARATGPRARPRGPAPAPEPSSSAPDATTTLDVAGEVAVLRRAKAAIERRAWAQASSTLAEYDASYPDGVLALDARALGVLVDCHGRTLTAEERAADFLQRHPTSSLRDRIRDACELDRDR